MFNEPLPNTIFETDLSDELCNENTVSMAVAEQLFNYFKNAPLFKWNGAYNNCEGRANAIGILLDEWNIPNYKGWAQGAFFLKNGYGGLLNLWNYHVATLLPVKENDIITYYIIDPATSSKLETIENWALQITAYGTSYHFIKLSKYYIYLPYQIERDNWHQRDKRNFRWTMQALCGINGVSTIGKAELCFKKKKIKRTTDMFKKLKNEKPYFLVN